jgi:hypothetical protein
MVQYQRFEFSHFSAWQLKTTLKLTSLIGTGIYIIQSFLKRVRPPTSERYPKFLLLRNRVR